MHLVHRLAVGSLAPSALGILSLACSAGAAHGGSATTASSGTGASGTGGGQSGSSSGSTSGAGGSVSNFPEAAHPSPPQVKNFGGPVLATPKIVSITFPGDSLATQIDDFAAKLGSTPYFTQNVAEYGVGPATFRGSVHLTANPFPATVDDAQIKTWLAQEIGASLPASDGSTLYALFFTEAQTVTHQGGSSCVQFAGYHGEAPLSGGSSATYAIVARCPTVFKGVTGIAQVTSTASHEIIEGSTNPLSDSKPAYQEVQAIDFGWELALGGEVADLCAQNADAFFQPPGFAYTVQRTWSNKAALAGHDPCVPAPSGAYFNSAPVMPDMIPINLILNGMMQTVGVAGVTIPIGSSKTIELDLFSDGAIGPWTVSAKDFTVPPQTPIVTFSFDKTSGQNGDKLHLTISPTVATFTNNESFIIESQVGGVTNSWIGLIGN